MAETPDQIEHDIEAERERLAQNLEQLETRIKRATDWRELLGKYPMAVLGAAFGVGFLLSMLTGPREAPERWYDGARRTTG
jgi:hypothetical protein